MDTRRDSRSRDGRAKAPELADLSDTGLVKVIDLETVGDAGWRNRPIVIVVVAVAGILAVAAMAAALSPRGPSPTAPAIAIVSPTPTSIPVRTSFDVRPASPRPTIRQSVTIPLEPPPWAWTREEPLPDVEFEPMGIWSVGEDVLVLARHEPSISGARPSWSIARSTAGRGWELVAAPAAIEEFLDGRVIDDRLWFLARVGGVTSASARWELVSTTNGEDWSSLGESQLGPLDGVIFVDRVADRWAAATWRHHWDDGAGEGAIRVDLRWSGDGVEWQPADLPAFEGLWLYYQAHMRGDTMVLFGANNLPDGGEAPFILHSTDGITWLEAPQPVARSHAATAFACGPTRCVIVATPTDSIVGAPTAFVTTDLQDWVASAIVAPASETGGYLTSVSVTDGGFMAMGSGTGYAFVSVDGLTWDSREVMVGRPRGTDSVQGMAVTDGRVVALVRDESDGSWSVWTGLVPPIDP